MGAAAEALAALADGTPRHQHGWPMRMMVCGIYEACDLHTSKGITHLISIQSPGAAYRGPDGFGDRHLIVSMDDRVDPGLDGAPRATDIARIMDFVDALPSNANLMVHCQMGLSRSTAVVLGLLAREVSPLRAGYLLHMLRPQAMPNALIVQLFDRHLGLEGALVEIGQRFPCQVWRNGDGLGNFPHRRKKR